MKTLNATRLKARKDNLQSKYEEEKLVIHQIDKAVEKLQAQRQLHLSNMLAQEAAYKELEELEKEIGIDPLATRVAYDSTKRRKNKTNSHGNTNL